MFKKLLSVLLILVIFLLSTPVSVFAQSLISLNQDRKILAQVDENKVVVSFADLGYSEASLASPYDAVSYFFNTPVNWNMIEGAELKLDFDVILSGADLGSVGINSNQFGGTLSVEFNRQLIGRIQLGETGSQSLRLDIPLSALANPREDGRNVLQIYLDAGFSCTKDIRTLVRIKTTSTFEIPFELASPELDLSHLPTPFYLRNSLLPDSSLLVVPDDPGALELQAAFNVLAGFGSMIDRDFNMPLVVAGQLTNDDLISNNLVFVGKPTNFRLLSEIQFPLPVVDGNFVNLAKNSNDDGIIELAVSPWNSDRSIMLVSGNSENAVLKAAQAVSSGNLQVYDDPMLVYVSDVQSIVNSDQVFENFTLQDLGYVTETLRGIGVDSVDYSFNVSKVQTRTKDAYFDLVFYHSGVTNFTESSIAVYLNDQVISSIGFSKESTSISSMKIIIPPGLLRLGENRLTISAKLQPEFSCETSGFSDPWMTVVDQSKFYIPAGVGESVFNYSRGLDFQFLPGLLLETSDLGDVAFILPNSNSLDWDIAGKIAYFLGREINPAISNLNVAFAEDIPNSIQATNSMIVIGKPSDLLFLQEINDKLPAPFNFEDNSASERNMQIVYRIPPEISVGYLQLLRSPFNIEKSMLVISGNSEDGVQMAGNTLLLSGLNNQLAGTFAITNGSQVATGGSSSFFSVIGTVVPDAQQVVVTPLAPVFTSVDASREPRWLLPTIGVSAFIVLSLLVHAIWSNISNNRAYLRVEESTSHQVEDTSSKEEESDT